MYVCVCNVSHWLRLMQKIEAKESFLLGFSE